MSLKKIVYLIASTFLGIILSFIIHAIIEILYLNKVDSSQVTWTSVWGKGACALPVWLQIGLLIIGIVGGYLLGRWWWRLVYIEKRHWRLKK